MAGVQGNGTPVYKKIKDAIRRRIESAELQPGDPVPSERELARTHRVSLMTARHALADLEREGMVERRLGAGTFVSAPKIHFNKLMSYSEQMSSRGLSPRSRMLVAKIVEHDPEIAARLHLPASSKMIKIERLRESSAEPLALETCYLAASEFSDLLRAPLGSASLFTTLSRNYGVELAYADEEVDATGAEANVSELLKLGRGIPVLRVRQVIYSTTGKPILYAVGFYRSEYHTLFIRRFRSDAS